MNDAGGEKKIEGKCQQWVEAWRDCMQNVLSQVLAKPAIFGTIVEPMAASESDTSFTVVAAGAVQGEMSLRLSQHGAIRLARKFLGEATAGAAEASDRDDALLTADEAEALQELLQQVAGLAATSVGALVGGNIRLRVSHGEASWFGTSDTLATCFTRDETGSEIRIELRLSPALAHALEAHGSADPSPSSAPENAGNSAKPSPAPASGMLPHAAGYRRLLDVGLGVKLRFGTRRMLLRDVLALSSGLVVELENPLNSPVDLLLDGRIIARGDVVVIDGNYGLRVSEVVEPATPIMPI